jgi:DNA-binding transcriptional LysR family regulator
VTDLCSAAGFVPHVICAGAEYATVFRLVGMGVGVTVASELATQMRVTPSPVFLPLDDPAAIITTVMVAGRGTRQSTAAMAFRALVLRRTTDAASDEAHGTNWDTDAVAALRGK